MRSRKQPKKTLILGEDQDEKRENNAGRKRQLQIRKRTICTFGVDDPIRYSFYHCFHGEIYFHFCFMGDILSLLLHYLQHFLARELRHL
jgi:hypothetical protein